MRRIIPTSFVLAFFVLAAAFLWAQRGLNAQSGAEPARERFEVRSVFPLETSPGVYEQVEQSELSLLADQGWELVGVEPYVIRNEERGPETPGPRPVVTQTYPAYFFKRVRLARQ